MCSQKNSQANETHSSLEVHSDSEETAMGIVYIIDNLIKFGNHKKFHGYLLLKWLTH